MCWTDIRHIDIGPGRICFYEQVISGENNSIGLTDTESRLLKRIVGGGGEVVCKKDLYRDVLGEEYEYNDRRIDVHVQNLRDKFREAGLNACLENDYGVGYLFSAG